jgi:hypothetical protein
MSEQRDYRYSPPAQPGPCPDHPGCCIYRCTRWLLSADLPHTAHPARTTAPLLQSGLPSRRAPQTQLITTATSRRPTATPRQH